MDQIMSYSGSNNHLSIAQLVAQNLAALDQHSSIRPPSFPQAIDPDVMKERVKDLQRLRMMDRHRQLKGPRPNTSNSGRQMSIGQTHRPMTTGPTPKQMFQADMMRMNALRVSQQRDEMRLSKEKKKIEQQEEKSHEDFGSGETKDTFSEYSPKYIDFGRPHPDPVVETSALSTVAPPAPEYTLSMPQYIIDDGLLSQLQLECVMLACDRHNRVLPSGRRSGFLIGDGAGIGKGRQIAGIVYENWIAGRRRSIWFSASGDLMDDAKRDFEDLGIDIPMYNLKKLPKGDINVGDALIFSTYTMLISKSSNGVSRLSTLMKWCKEMTFVDETLKRSIVSGDNFDGCIIFDECHKAKNLNVTSKSAKPTATARDVVAIQEGLPKGRVVYVSATGASILEHLAYMSRLGLWGESTSFEDNKDFMLRVGKRGVGAMEMVATSLKGAGLFVSRMLSYRDAEFDVVYANLSPEYRTMYDAAAQFWIDLRGSFEDAIDFWLEQCPEVLTADKKNPEVQRLKRLMTIFWGSHQRFFRALCMAAKVPKLVSLAKEALLDGKCVVVGMQSTGEARLKGVIEDVGEMNVHDFVSSMSAIVDHLLRNFPVSVLGITNPVFLKKRDSFFERNKNIELPINPLDSIIDELGGADKVAEMTGRTGRVIRRDGKLRYEKRTTGLNEDSVNIQERKLFQDGTKLVSIISDAASTGVSLQADRRVKNQRRRFHITLELPWSADKAVQQLGRSHRSNQTSAPIYRLLVSQVGGEFRFASAVARRLEGLGALTQGDRKANAGSSDMSLFNIDSSYGLAALKELYQKLIVGLDKYHRELHINIELPFITPEYTMTKFQDESSAAFIGVGMIKQSKVRSGSNTVRGFKIRADSVSVFLNRLLGIPLELHQKIFRFFLLLLERKIAVAKEENKFSDGIVDISCKHVSMVAPPAVIFEDPSTKAAALHYSLEADRGVSFVDAFSRLQSAHDDDRNGFYKPVHSPQTSYLLAIGRFSDRRAWTFSSAFQITRPNTGIAGQDFSRSKLESYVKVEPREAEKWWNETYLKHEVKCTHQRRQQGVCPGDSCTQGIRKTKINIMAGAVLPLWSLLEKQFDDEKHMKIVRVNTDKNVRVVGLLIPFDRVNSMISSTKALNLKNKNNATDAMKHVKSTNNADGGLRSMDLKNWNSTSNVLSSLPTIPIDQSSSSISLLSKKTILYPEKDVVIVADDVGKIAVGDGIPWWNIGTCATNPVVLSDSDDEEGVSICEKPAVPNAIGVSSLSTSTETISDVIFVEAMEGLASAEASTDDNLQQCNASIAAMKRPASPVDDRHFRKFKKNSDHDSDIDLEATDYDSDSTGCGSDSDSILAIND